MCTENLFGCTQRPRICVLSFWPLDTLKPKIVYFHISLRKLYTFLTITNPYYTDFNEYTLQIFKSLYILLLIKTNGFYLVKWPPWNFFYLYKSFGVIYFYFSVFSFRKKKYIVRLIICFPSLFFFFSFFHPTNKIVVRKKN